jgi:isopentenyl-diphosphate delta-isomerase
LNSSKHSTDAIVSFDSENLILVNEQDQEIGYQDKLHCHDGDGILHRAFSLFIFNALGELLLQQRSANKRLWPLYWSNSCCSHPRRGETMQTAVNRRLQQELGFQTELQYLYKFKYQVPYKDIGSEHELCSVFIGQSSSPVQPNENEIADFRFISCSALEQEMQLFPDKFTPWFKMEWEHMKKQHRKVLLQLKVELPDFYG